MINDPGEICADWSREYRKPWEWNPGKSLLATLRSYQKLKSEAGFLNVSLRRWVVLQHRFWSCVSGADIPLNCQIGGGLLLPHPNGVVIHPRAKVGPNCLLFQQVTLGALRGEDAPVLEGHVDVGAGAKLLGNIRIGKHALVGANAVVLIDVPSGATAVGVPAYIVKGSDA